jgi:pimeloyl-ACP methyl ester carboxylesterase
MGVSLGTIIALQMREMHPTKVISVILPGAIIKLNRKLRILANLSLGMAKIIGYHAFYKMSARIMMPRRNHKKSRDVFIRESQFLSIEEFKKWTSMYYNLDKTLKNLFFKKSTIPQLMVMGDQDHLFLEPATEYAKEHDNTQIEIIQKCGHVVSIEKAKQFNTICLKFLSDLEAFVSE